jgi:hypothetical protein
VVRALWLAGAVAWRCATALWRGRAGRRTARSRRGMRCISASPGIGSPVCSPLPVRQTDSARPVSRHAKCLTLCAHSLMGHTASALAAARGTGLYVHTLCTHAGWCVQHGAGREQVELHRIEQLLTGVSLAPLAAPEERGASLAILDVQCSPRPQQPAHGTESDDNDTATPSVDDRARGVRSQR